MGTQKTDLIPDSHSVQDELIDFEQVTPPGWNPMSQTNVSYDRRDDLHC